MLPEPNSLQPVRQIAENNLLLLGRLIAIPVLGHKMPRQGPPILVDLFHIAVNMLRNHLGRFLGVLLVELGGLLLEVGLLREELALEALLLGADVPDHRGEVEVRPVAHEVERPPRGLGVELDAVAGVVGLGDRLRPRVDGYVARRDGLVLSEPRHGRQGLGQSIAHLANKADRQDDSLHKP